MGAVRAEVEGAIRTGEVVQPDAPLGREVEDAGIPVRAVILQADGGVSIGGELVVCPKESACCLCPGSNSSVPREVPAQNNGRYAYAGERSADGVGLCTFNDAVAWNLRAAYLLKPWRVGLKEGEDLHGVLEVAAKDAVADVVCEDTSSLNSRPDEVKASTLIRESISELEDGPELQRLVGGCIFEHIRGRIVLRECCRSAEKRGKEEKRGTQVHENWDLDSVQALTLECGEWAQRRTGRRSGSARPGAEKKQPSGQGGFVEVEVRVDVLRVVEVFNGFEQPYHCTCLGSFELGIGACDLGDLGSYG